MSSERFASLVLTVMRASPNLNLCAPMSVLAAAVQAAQLHLEPGPMAECYIVPWPEKKGGQTVWLAQFLVSYRGIVALAHRAGVTVTAMPVYTGDEFDFGRGTGDGDFLHHKPALRDRGDLDAYYGLAKWFVDGHRENAYEVMSYEAVLGHRDRYAKATDSRGNLRGPWKDNEDAMCRKTLIRQLSPWIPKATALRTSLYADETVRSELAQITPDMAGDAYVDRELEHAADRAADRAADELPVTPATGKCLTCSFDLPEHADNCPEAGG
jgi:recombination protein RecT